MRNYVSTMLIGAGVAFKAPETLTEGELIGFDVDTRGAITAASKIIAFAQGTANLGEPVISGHIPVSGISSANRNDYVAAVAQERTLTVDSVPAAGDSAFFKVAYHDNLSIIPNQIKQTIISVEAEAGETTTTFAAKIAAEFNKQDYLFVTVTSATNVVTFVAKTLTTSSNYNGIDRPETVFFEVGAPADSDGLGTYTEAQSVAGKPGQGDPAKIAWMAEQHQGRLGFSDRRSWNDGKKYVAPVDAAKNYDVIVINADIVVEGDMQGVRSNPVGVVLAVTEDTPVGAGLFYEQLALAVTLTSI